MREVGEGDSAPSKGKTASASDERKEKRFWIRPRRPLGRPNNYDSTTTTYDFLRLGLYSVVVVVLPGFAGSSLDHTLRSHQFPRTPLIFLLPGPLRSSASMSDPQHQPNPTASVYALRYLRLLDILRDERATEPRLNTAEPAEWLNWAHATRWLIVSGQSLVPSAPCSVSRSA